MAWTGTGVLWALKGGVLRSVAMDPRGMGGEGAAAGAELTFVQISDSHIGFDKPANPDVAATLGEAVNRINALPALLRHFCCTQATSVTYRSLRNLILATRS